MPSILHYCRTAFHVSVLALAVLGSTGIAWQGGYESEKRDQQIAERFRQNTTKTTRAKPMGLAVKAGSGIQWQTDLKKALESSQQSGKPVFWYVPTLQKTFMDRKDVIDQYMMAGPFSWPSIINLINENFTPVKFVPSNQVAAEYGVANYKFVEPGFVVIEAGKVTGSVDRLTTLHPRWLFEVIKKFVAKDTKWDELSGTNDRTAINQAWASYINRQPIDADLNVPATDVMELKLLQGMELFRAGKHDQAQKWWGEASQQHPDHPLAWKAANEAQGIGPFVRGFEVFLPLNAQQSQAGVKSLGSAAPEGTFSADQLWTLTATYLLDMQREDGGFYDSDYDFGGIDSMPNVHMAVTAICGWALAKAETRVDKNLAMRIGPALQKAIAFCTNDQNLNPKDRDEILWAEAYRLRFLSSLSAERKTPELLAFINQVAKRLEDLQSGNGSWFHEYPNAFVTATALIALKDAKQAGANVDTLRIESGLKRLENQRYPNGAYPYSIRRGNPNRSEPIEASAGRTPLCSFARFLWAQEDDSQLAASAEIGLKYHELLAKALKYDNHTDTHAFGGFFFWYDMHARSEAIAAVGDLAKRKQFAQRQLDLILKLPELDGCFVDSHELGRCYGTASAMLCLCLMQESLAATK